MLIALVAVLFTVASRSFEYVRLHRGGKWRSLRLPNALLSAGQPTYYAVSGSPEAPMVEHLYEWYARRASAQSPIPALVIVARDEHRTTGVWSPLLDVDARALWCELRPRGTLDSTVTLGALGATRAGAIYDQLIALEPGRFSASARADDFTNSLGTRTPLWGGIANDAAMCVVVALLWPARLGVIQVWRRLRRNAAYRHFESRRPDLRCQYCQYDLRGLQRQICPECGARFC